MINYLLTYLARAVLENIDPGSFLYVLPRPRANILALALYKRLFPASYFLPVPVPRYNTIKYGKHSIRYLGPHIWGKIGQELRSKTSLQAFRRGERALNVLGLLDGTCGCCACSS